MKSVSGKSAVRVLGLFVFSAMTISSFAPSIARACDLRQMLFFGTVHNVQRTGLKTPACTFQVSIDKYWMSDVCPLAPGEAAALDFEDPKCQRVVGEKIDGELSNDGEHATFR